jgi:hypothetical protein
MGLEPTTSGLGITPGGNGNNGNSAVSIVNNNQLQESSNGIEVHQREPFGTKSGPVVAPEVMELVMLWPALTSGIQQSILTIARTAAQLGFDR